MPIGPFASLCSNGKHSRVSQGVAAVSKGAYSSSSESGVCPSGPLDAVLVAGDLAVTVNVHGESTIWDRHKAPKIAVLASSIGLVLAYYAENNC